MAERIDPFFIKRQKDDKPKGAHGKHVYDIAFQFYSWYLSRDGHLEFHRDLYKSLCIIMQIAKLSSGNGQFLSKEDEEYFSEKLTDSLEDFKLGAINTSNLCQFLQDLLQTLITSNTVAKLIYELMTIEYKFLIEDNQLLGEDDKHILKEHLEYIFEKISPKITNLHAQTASRQLAWVINEKTTAEKLKKVVEEVKHLVE